MNDSPEVGQSGSGQAAGGEPGRRRVGTSPAIWGIIGALIGSLVTGFFSIQAASTAAETSVKTAEIARQTAELGMTAEARRSREEFLRTERLSGYVEQLSLSQRAMNAANTYAYRLQYQSYFSPDALTAASNELSTSYEDWVNSAWHVRVIASDAVSAVNDKMATKMDEAYRMLVNYRAQPGELDAIVAFYAQFLTEMSNLRTEFTTASQAEFEDAG